VPRDLHFEFLARLDTRPGESPIAKAGRLVAFYAAAMGELPATEAVGDPYKFWKAAFAAWVASEGPTRDTRTHDTGGPRLTGREIQEADLIRTRAYGGCPHDPRCEDRRDCVREIALARRVG